MILEGLVTTTLPDGGPHLAPMGPRIEDAGARLLLRPYRGSTTLENLRRTGQGVFHLVDDVLLLAQAAIHAPWQPPPEFAPAAEVAGYVLPRACGWLEFRVQSLDTSAERAEITALVVARGQGRPFSGLNRARHAVLEAAILATRTGLLPAAEVWPQLERLAVLVEKTAGPEERQAWDLLQDHFRRAYAAQAAPPSHGSAD